MFKNVFLLAACILFALCSAQAQAPSILNYQAVARNSVGTPLPNQTMQVRLSILNGSATGSVVYSEIRSVATNAVGLFVIQIGSAGAINTSGNLSTLNWSNGSKFLKVEIDPLGGSSFIDLGTNQLVSVPYALSASPSGTAGGDLTGTYPNPVLADKSVTTQKMADLSVTFMKLSDQAVTTAKLADGSVTDIKIQSVSGSKVTGNISGNAANVTGTVAVANGGTGAVNATDARKNLGLVIGTDVQAPLTAGKDYLTPTGSALGLTNFPILNQNTTGNAATVTTNANLTGVVTSVGNTTSIANGAITNAMLANSAVANLSGTNTGDQDLSGLATKTELALKANTSDVNTSLALKANAADVTTSLALKANTADLANKVDKVIGKELSTNDYTTAEKAKLAAITGTNTGDQDLSGLATNTALALKANTADVNTSLALKANAADVTTSLALKANTTDLANKVDKVTGKELSTNDYTTAEKAKLTAITGTNTGDQDLSGLATNTALALKANTADVNTSLALKANAADVTTSLALKANTADLANKVDKVIGKELSTNDYTTAEKAKLAAITGTNTGDQDLSGLATNTALALKANTADVNTSLALKANAADLANKVDKVTGKELSTNDYTTAEKAKLAAITGTNTGDQDLSGLATNTALALKLNIADTASMLSNRFARDTASLSNRINLKLNIADTASMLSNRFARDTASLSSRIDSSVPYTGATGAVNLGAYDLTVNGLTVGKGAGGVSSNTAIGLNSLNSNTTGAYSTANGHSALYSNTTGSNNNANGAFSLYSNTTGYNNTANGSGALRSNTTGSSNTATGAVALTSNTTGIQNTAYGEASLRLNTTGNYNTAYGTGSLELNTTGLYNTANGLGALYSNTTGNGNTANGLAALVSNTTGTGNTGIGNGADVATGNLSNATAIGYGAKVAASNTIQLGNTNVTNVNTSGTISAGAVTYPNTHGAANQVLSTNGSGTLTWTTPSSITVGAIGTSNANAASIASGVLSLSPADGTNGGIVTIGSQTIAGAKTFTTDLTVNGLTVGKGAGGITTNTAIGLNSLYSNTTGSQNTANGRGALYSNTTGSANTGNGHQALFGNTTGSGNTGNGYKALLSNTTGGFNTANGNVALYSNTTGSQNTANGVEALYYNTTGSNNTANGTLALRNNTTGSNNTANGDNTLIDNTTGSDNTANGVIALARNTTGSGNTANGNGALYSNTTGDYNTAIGKYAGINLSTGSNNTMIGYEARASAIGVNNEITLGNTSVTVLRANTSSITSLSDRRDKTDIADITEGLPFIKQLRPVVFTWNTRDKAKVGIKSAGFIAQELLALQKQSKIGANLDLVSENNPDKLEARYGNLLPVIVKAVQEQQNIIDMQQKQIDELKKLVESLIKH